MGFYDHSNQFPSLLPHFVKLGALRIRIPFVVQTTNHIGESFHGDTL